MLLKTQFLFLCWNKITLRNSAFRIDHWHCIVKAEFADKTNDEDKVWMITWSPKGDLQIRSQYTWINIKIWRSMAATEGETVDKKQCEKNIFSWIYAEKFCNLMNVSAKTKQNESLHGRSLSPVSHGDFSSQPLIGQSHITYYILKRATNKSGQRDTNPVNARRVGNTGWLQNVESSLLCPELDETSHGIWCSKTWQCVVIVWLNQAKVHGWTYSFLFRTPVIGNSIVISKPLPDGERITGSFS